MYYEDIALNAAFPLRPVAIRKDRMLSFARDYDPLPLHLDEEYAKGTRFGALIAPGVMTFMSVWTQFLEINLFADELVAGKSTKIEWIRPVYADDVLTGTAEITGKTRRSAGSGVVEVSVRAHNQHGVLVLTNVTEVVVKCRSASE